MPYTANKTKQNYLGNSFIYKCKADPIKSQEKRLQVEKLKKDMAILLFKTKSRALHWNLTDEFHLLPQSGCISGYSRRCIWNILLKLWCFNFSRNYWFLTWSCFDDSLSWPETRVKIFRPSYGMRYRANKTKQEPPRNHFMEERLQIVKSKTNKQKRCGRSLDQQQIKACNWTLISFIFPQKVWFLTVIVLTKNMYDHKSRFPWLETTVLMYFWTWTREAYMTYKVLVFRFQISFLIGRLLTRSRINHLVKPSVGPENHSLVRWVGEWTILVERNWSTMLVSFA